jgi:hypothetical protein
MGKQETVFDIFIIHLWLTFSVEPEPSEPELELEPHIITAPAPPKRCDSGSATLVIWSNKDEI